MDLGFWLTFGAGALVGGAIAVVLLCALVMASGADDGEAGDYRPGGGWGG